MGVVLGGVVVVIVVVAVVHELRPGRNPSLGGQPLLDGVSGAIWLLGTVVAILIGALAGSYDVAQGTMRYLVMTGVGRTRMYAGRTIAMVAAVLLALTPALVLGISTAAVLPHTRADAVAPGEIADVVWTCTVWPVVFALIALGIGSLLRSNGPAIAISLIFAFAAAPVLALIESVSKPLGEVMLLQALGRITGDDQGAALPVAALAVVAWVSLFWVAGAIRIRADEY